MSSLVRSVVRGVVSGLAVCGALVAAGCSSGSSGNVPDLATDSSAATGPSGDAPSLASGCTLTIGEGSGTDGAVVVLADGGLFGSDGLPADVVDGVVDALDRVTDGRDVRVSVGTFGPSDADVRFDRCLDGVAFVPRGNNDATRARRRPRLLGEVRDRVVALPGGYVGVDPTAALRAGASRLEVDGGQRTLIIFTDGVPTTGCAALPDPVDPLDPTLVDQLVGRCVAGEMLPSLSGIRVVIAGVGRGSQAMSSEAVTFLLRLNEALCEQTGADCSVSANAPVDL